MDLITGRQDGSEVQDKQTEDREAVDAMLDQFLALPEVVAVGGLEMEEAPIATDWPID
jgi:hypothetical protein